MHVFIADTRGSTGTLFALAVPVLVVLAAFSVDYSDAVRERQSLQSAADTASLRATKALLTTLGPASAKKSAAEAIAGDYIQAHAPESSKQVLVFMRSEGDTEDAVAVDLSHAKPLHFAGPLASPTWNIAVSAKAVAGPTTPACVIALDPSEPTGIEMQGSSSLEAAECTVWSNAEGPNSMDFAPATATTAARICAAGTVSGSGTQTPSVETDCEQLQDPYAERSFPTFSVCEYPYTEVKKDAVLNPGVYCGLTIQGSGISITLNPGLYVILDEALTLMGTPVIDGAAGISFYLAGSSYFDIQGNPTVNLAAMTTGPLAGLSIASDPLGPELTSTMQGNVTATLHAHSVGAIYLPNQRLSLTGSVELNLNGSRDRLVARALSVEGNASLNVSSDDIALQEGTIASLRLTR